MKKSKTETNSQLSAFSDQLLQSRKESMTKLTGELGPQLRAMVTHYDSSC